MRYATARPHVSASMLSACHLGLSSTIHGRLRHVRKKHPDCPASVNLTRLDKPCLHTMGSVAHCVNDWPGPEVASSCVPVLC